MHGSFGEFFTTQKSVVSVTFERMGSVSRSELIIMRQVDSNEDIRLSTVLKKQRLYQQQQQQHQQQHQQSLLHGHSG
jgi:hypothetical protein